jgi:tyrosyl-tRNA synthetase
VTAGSGKRRRPGIEEQIRVLMRGVEYGDQGIRATMESELRERLKEGRPLRIYCGYDPTSTDLTLGNAVSMRKLRQFQDLGHEVTFLIGNFTGLVGDPSDKDSARPMLTPEQAKANSRTWLRQAYRVLDREKTIVRYNADWLGKLTMADVVQLASRFTVAQFLERDIYVLRRERGEAIYLHEFLYALLQAYDAVAMETDAQVGGTDQLFNIMAGRTLQRALGQQPQIAICLPMLLGTDGKSKMSKSLGNHIGLDDPPYDMYGKVMSIPDDVMMDYFTLVTDVSEEELAEMGGQLAARSVNPMELKKRLAREIVAQYHGAKAARAAEQGFTRVFQQREQPESVEEITLPKAAWEAGDTFPRMLPSLLKNLGVVASVSEGKRLLAQGAVELDGEKLSLENALRPRPGMVIRVGKHRFLRIVDADKQNKQP